MGKGNAKIRLYDINGVARDIMLDNSLYVTSYEQDIFSVHAAIDKGASILSLEKHVKQFRSPEGATFNIEQKGRLGVLFKQHIIL